MKKIITQLAAAAFSITGIAQTNFTGMWVIKEKTHVTGPEYSNAIPSKIIVEQRKDSLILQSTNVGPDGKDFTSRQAIAMNGKQSTINSVSSKRKYVRSLAWSTDKKTLAITTVFYIPENENEVDFTRVETWAITDGKLNINKKSIETRSETWEVNANYVKSE